MHDLPSGRSRTFGSGGGRSYRERPHDDATRASPDSSSRRWTIGSGRRFLEGRGRTAPHPTGPATVRGERAGHVAAHHGPARTTRARLFPRASINLGFGEMKGEFPHITGDEFLR